MNITIKLATRELVLSLDEAKQLHKELSELFQSTLFSMQPSYTTTPPPFGAHFGDRMKEVAASLIANH